MLVNDSFAIHTLQSLISSLDVAISVINTKGEIVYWNEVAEKTYQIKKDEIITLSLTS
ncbi:PAS domain-containing protein [Metabacillus sediminilitoris]|uniref:PAS domain-containing protein n=1 Tax=Metabacillus sediminilitoris TaxID=2567941 RepID=A0A4S4BYB8_9BACI|nr:PAS domain-containing protein [Metabacillus sediminilitoris]QGQ44180.1 PAS domain-containing protein [Metabacillus sediminilitoris]THF78144.1 PAS domain-containing protein [Metabacillus sediminilitoris]